MDSMDFAVEKKEGSPKDHKDFHEQFIRNVCKDFLNGTITEAELKADIFNENWKIVKISQCPDWLLKWADENPGAAREALIKEYLAEVEILASVGMTDKQGRYNR